MTLSTPVGIMPDRTLFGIMADRTLFGIWLI